MGGRWLTFEGRAHALFSVFASANDWNEVARVENSDEVQREGGDQQVSGELRDVRSGHDGLPCERCEYTSRSILGREGGHDTDDDQRLPA